MTFYNRSWLLIWAIVPLVITGAKPSKKLSNKKTPVKQTQNVFPEMSLIGIQLFDTTTQIVKKHGSPHKIESAEPEKKTQEGEEAEDNKKLLIHLVRWIYKKPSAQYSFTLNPQGRVVQIECLGLKDSICKTKKGIELGTPFSKVIEQYGSPENYTLLEQYSLARYHTNHHLAFKLASTEPGTPLKVVGILLTNLKVQDKKIEQEKSEQETKS